MLNTCIETKQFDSLVENRSISLHLFIQSSLFYFLVPPFTYRPSTPVPSRLYTGRLPSPGSVLMQELDPKRRQFHPPQMSLDLFQQFVSCSRIQHLSLHYHCRTPLILPGVLSLNNFKSYHGS